jgi:sugar phosphate isomerase/epimerase
LGRIAPASGALVALSSSSVFPERMPDAFETAAKLGYDGVEVMVTTDLISQDVDVLRRLVDYHGIPVLAVHAPCLLITQRVWGREPWGKLGRARQAAEQLGARVVVLHPPFRWQREYAREFEARLARKPTCCSRWRTCTRSVRAAPRWRPTPRTGTRSNSTAAM